MHDQRFKAILGIDLGGGKGKKTALAVLRPDVHGVAVARVAPRVADPPLYDGTLLEFVRGVDDALLCIDAPLTLPPCLRCRVAVCPGQTACVDPAVREMERLATAAAPGKERGRTAARDGRRGKPEVTPYTQRATEVFLATCRGITPRETLGQGMGPLTGRAVHLLRALANRFRLNENLLEVYPKATLAALGLGQRYKKHIHERENRAAILEALHPNLHFAPGVWREECVQSDHVFDAVICAYTGYLWARDGWTLPSDTAAIHAVDGWIWIPPTAQDAARDVEPAAAEA